MSASGSRIWSTTKPGQDHDSDQIIAAPLNPQMFFVSPLQAIADIAGSVGFHAGLPEFGSNSLKG
jgi:hypothetical protein